MRRWSLIPSVSIRRNSCFNRLIVFILFFFIYGVSFCQIKIYGGFISDSLKIGERTAFYLAAHYPREQNILFPDSNYSYTPFEFEKKIYFSTKTHDSISVDSSVYYLTTFEVERVLKLDLPVFVIHPQDCTAVQSPKDSILVIQLVAQVPDSLAADKLPLKMNTAYQKVYFDFNFVLMLIALGVLLVAGTLVWIFFGKRILKYMRTRKLMKKHAAFIQAYNDNLEQLKSAFSSLIAESALSTWKKYMEQLEAFPYTKLTTKEMMGLVNDEILGRNLHTIDTAIYGHNTAVLEPLENLKTFADQRFSQKLEAIKHGQ